MHIRIQNLRWLLNHGIIVNLPDGIFDFIGRKAFTPSEIILINMKFDIDYEAAITYKFTVCVFYFVSEEEES